MHSGGEIMQGSGIQHVSLNDKLCSVGSVPQHLSPRPGWWGDWTGPSHCNESNTRHLTPPAPLPRSVAKSDGGAKYEV